MRGHRRLSSVWALRMSRFRGGTSIWSIGVEFAAERPQISKFRRRNPLELETPKTGGSSTTQTVWLPSSLASWGQIELQGVGLAFGRISQEAKTLGSETALSGFDASNEISGFSCVPGSGEARFRVFFDWTAADFLDSYPGFHLDSYLDAAIPGL